MAHISIAEVKENMILADTLIDRNGCILLNKGTTLTPNHLRILEMRGIAEVPIEKTSPERTDDNCQENPEARSRAESLARLRFCHTDLEHPFMSALFRIAVSRKTIELEQETVPSRNGGNTSFSPSTAAAPITITSDKLLDLIKNDVRLPTLLSIYKKINEVIMDPGSSAHTIADVIGKDSSLTARLLKLVNSSFYGFPSKIETLSRAVAIVGTRQLSMLTAGIDIVNSFTHIPSDVIDIKSCWRHNIACGALSRVLAGCKNIENSERIFVGGLLHDIGRLVLYNYAPRQSAYLLAESRSRSRLLDSYEQEMLGYTHAFLGGLLLKRWKLPLSLESMVMHHHRPDPSQYHLETAIVHVADIIVNALEIGSSGESLVPPLDPEAWKRIDLPTAALPSAIEQMECQVDEVLQFFISGI